MNKPNLNPAIELRDITKKFNTSHVLKNISLTVPPNTVMGILGPNGAGKTTLLNIILGLITPTSGSIRIFGKDLSLKKQELLQSINFAAPYARLPGNLSIEENLLTYAYLYNEKHPREAIQHLIQMLGIEKMKKQMTGSLSSGEQSLAGLAKAFINRPKLLLLDEPTASLDFIHAEHVRSIIKKYATEENTTVVWTSHNMREMETMCDQIAIISKGSLLAAGTPQGLYATYGGGELAELFQKVTHVHQKS